MAEDGNGKRQQEKVELPPLTPVAKTGKGPPFTFDDGYHLGSVSRTELYTEQTEVSLSSIVRLHDGVGSASCVLKPSEDSIV